MCVYVCVCVCEFRESQGNRNRAEKEREEIDQTEIYGLSRIYIKFDKRIMVARRVLI